MIYIPLMWELIVVSCIWALSFGLIKETLTGMDPFIVAWIRIFLSLLVFIPFVRIKKEQVKILLPLFFIGSIQFGLMYVSYIASYQYLYAHEVAMFTILTPIYVVLINVFIEKIFTWKYLLLALLAVVGTSIIVYKNITRNNFLIGFLLIQISNIAFAWGQLKYKNIMKNVRINSNKNVFAVLYCGAFVLVSLGVLFRLENIPAALSIKQLLVLLYLGVIASGLCFFLWNRGARKVSYGFLAVVNNLKVPLAVVAAYFIWAEIIPLKRLLVGGTLIILASFLSKRINYKV